MRRKRNGVQLDVLGDQPLQKLIPRMSVTSAKSQPGDLLSLASDPFSLGGEVPKTDCNRPASAGEQLKAGTP